MAHRAVPAGEGGPPHPLLVLLHGRGADEDDLLGIAEELDPRLAAVSIRAPRRWLVGYAWYDPPASGAPDPSDLREGLELIRATVEAEVARGVADPGRLFALGFSQGAVMVGALLLTGAVSLAGGIMLSGALSRGAGIEGPADDVRGRHVFLGHGRYDEVIPPVASRSAADWLRQLGAEVSLHTYDVAHRISLEELRDVDRWVRARLGASAQGGEWSG